jgi:hypothetical protein
MPQMMHHPPTSRDRRPRTREIFTEGSCGERVLPGANEGTAHPADASPRLLCFAHSIPPARPGVPAIRVWINEGHLAVGDDMMRVLVGGDIRDNVFGALQEMVRLIKTECVKEREIGREGGLRCNWTTRWRRARTSTRPWRR